jgi:hypothetical protein
MPPLETDMSPSGGTLRLISLAGLLCTFALLHPPHCETQGSNGAASEAHVIFAVSKLWDAKAQASVGSRPFIDAVALVENGRYVAPPKPAGPKKQPAPETSRFEAEYFAAGKQYAVFLGGGPAGSVAVVGPRSINCVSLSAEVSDSESLQDDDVRALATSLPITPRPQPASRRPTMEEEAAVLQLASAIFRIHGARSSALKRIRIERLTVADLDGDQRPELIGSFALRDKGERAVMLVASPKGSDYKADLSWHFAGSDAPDDRQRRYLVDHLDLDADGVDEIVVRMEDHDDWKYGIYKKEKKSWKLVYTGGGGDC